MPHQDPAHLQEQVEGYLIAAEFTLRNEREGFVAADRPAVGGDKETVMVWLLQPPMDDQARRRLSQTSRLNQTEVLLLDEIEETISQYQVARRTVLVPTREGLTRDFSREAHRLGVKILVPVQFFDAPFRIEQASDSASTIKALRNPDLIRRRVPQPYTVDKSSNPPSNGDLLDTLQDKFVRQEGPSLQIVMGPAGAGKSLLFSLSSLFFMTTSWSKRAGTTIFHGLFRYFQSI